MTSPPRLTLALTLGLCLGACASADKTGLLGAPRPQMASVASATAAHPVTGAASDAMAIPEALVIEGTLAVAVDEILDIVPALRTHVETLGGRVINEAISGAEQSWSARLKLRLSPAKVETVVAFLAGRGDITSKQVSASDVSRTLFDQELAIKNLRVTLERLTQVMATPGLQVAQILEVEKEMTRVRGEIDRLEGEQRFLADRVAYATLDVSLSRREGAVTVASAKIYPGARTSALVLFDPGTRARTRMGAGLVIHSFLRTWSLDVDVFEQELDPTGMTSSNAVIATTGGAVYSDFLGGGKRRVLNPYLGMRMGYAYLDTHRFVVQGEAGIELFRSAHVVIDASVRASAMFGKAFDLGLVPAAGATFAF